MTKQAIIEQKTKDLEEAHQAIEVRNLIIGLFAPQVLVYPADPPAPVMQNDPYEPIILAKPPTLQSFLSENMHNLIAKHPGFLFDLYFSYRNFTHPGEPFLIGYTLDKTRLVLVPQSLFETYKKQCLNELGYTGEPDYFAEADENPDWDEDDERAAEEASAHPSPMLRAGTWKARQVAHFVNEEETTPVVEYPVWPNGTWG